MCDRIEFFSIFKVATRDIERKKSAGMELRPPAYKPSLS